MLGLTVPMIIFVGYIYMMEFVQERNSQHVASVIMGNDQLIMTLASLWFMFLSRDWKTFYITSTVIMAFSYIIVLWTVPESPKFLVA